MRIEFFRPFVAIAFCLSSAVQPAAGDVVKTIGRPVPFEILDPPWLEARQQSQLDTVPDFGVFIDFKFHDRLPQSGITFRNRVVEDAAITYKAVHYDHGNGLAVADIDNDGRPDLYFVNQVGANELWRNLGDGRFENITERAGVAAADRISVSASFADIDNDGDADLYVTSVRQGNLVFENLGDGRFVDISDLSGLAHRGHSSGAAFFDYDRDGLLDLYLSNVGVYTSKQQRRGLFGDIEYEFYDGLTDAFGGHRFPERTEKSLLFRNLGKGTFEDVSKILVDSEAGWSGDATAVDVNEDGWPDIYELNMQGHDQYYENQDGKAFVRKSRDVFLKTSWGAMGIKSFDWNNDGHLDIFITDMHSDMSKDVGPDEETVKSDMQWNENHLKSAGSSIFGNTFFENRGKGKFSEISDRIGAESYWPWGLSVGDLNADGYQDVFITSGMNYPFRYQSNSILINDQGKRFRPAEFILGAEPRREGKTAQPWFDLDCSGMSSRHRLCADANGPVQVWGALGSRSSAIVDLDGDGDLDIVTNEFNGTPMVLLSDLAQTAATFNYVAIKLRGTRSNRDGIGARVSVKAGATRLTQTMDGKSGYLSQSVMPLYFGLGDASRIDEIRIQWPDGKTQTLQKPGVNATIEITEE
jgi:hypothetical protein